MFSFTFKYNKMTVSKDIAIFKKKFYTYVGGWVGGALNSLYQFHFQNLRILLQKTKSNEYI